MSSPISIPPSPRSSSVQSALTDAISTPVSSSIASSSHTHVHVNAKAGPSNSSRSGSGSGSGSRPPSTRRATQTPPSIKKDWAPITRVSGSGAAVVSVAGKVGTGEQSEISKRGEGVERGLSELIIRSDRTPDKKLSTLSTRTSASRMARRSSSERREAEEVGSPTGKKGWGISLVSGAVNAGVYGAALGVTAYKLWTQSSTQTFDPSIPSSKSAPANLASNNDNESEEDEAGPSTSPARISPALPAAPLTSEIAPPPAYRERDHADNLEWSDELDDEDLITPNTSRTPTVRISSHQHPLLHNTPSRSAGKKRRPRIPSGGLPKRSTLGLGGMTPPLVRPTTPPSDDNASNPIPIGEEAVATVVEGQEEILDRLDGMTLRIQRLILEGQAALIRKPEDMDGGRHARGNASGSWSRRGRGGSPRPTREGPVAGQGKVIRSRRSLPVVEVTMGQ